MSWYFKVHSTKLVPNDSIYTAQQFFFNNGQPGYVGLVNHSNGSRQINFSIWDSFEGSGTAQTIGACNRFTTEGSGAQCPMYNAAISDNVWYNITVRKSGRVDSASQHGDVWTARLNNVDTNAVTEIGSILLLDNAGQQGYGDLKLDNVGFIEYFNHHGSTAPCSTRSGYDFEYYGPVYAGTQIPTTVSHQQNPCNSVTSSSDGRGYHRVAFDPTVNTPSTYAAGANYMSPIPSTPPGTKVAFQANTSNLYATAPEAADNQLGIMPGTSPAITELPGGGQQTAFQANTGHLWTVGTLGHQDWGLGMMPGTSPSITALSGGGFQVAFQANTGNLWTVGTLGHQDWGLAMMPGTSPAITAVSGGFQVAFQANTGNLWTAGTEGSQDLRMGMKTGTSPAIT